MLDSGCRGCPYCEFPYVASVPVKNRYGKYASKTFNNIEDVWDVIWLIKDDTIANSKGNEYSIAGSVSTQLPFFCCPDHIRDGTYSTIINKYFYCKEFRVNPFKGSYEDTPVKWIQQSTIIKQAINIIEKRAMRKSKNK